MEHDQEFRAGLRGEEESFAHVLELSQHSAPTNIQAAEHRQIKHLHEEKLDLLKSKSFAQFNASSSGIVAKTIGAFEALAQYEDHRCGGTTTYFGQGETSIAQTSTGTK
jgi:hypothetical protein